MTDDEKRALAIELFNHTWTLMKLTTRTPDDDDAMLAAAYASAHFWRDVGKPANLARSQWQLSRVYTLLGREEPALYHARRCLALCEANDLWGWDRPYAYEALARASACAGDRGATEAYLARARELGATIEKQADRDLLLGDLATIPLPP